MDAFTWIDPADAIFVRSCREALAMERKAWEACHKSRMRAVGKLAAIRKELERLDGQQGG